MCFPMLEILYLKSCLFFEPLAVLLNSFSPELMLFSSGVRYCVFLRFFSPTVPGDILASTT